MRLFLGATFVFVVMAVVLAYVTGGLVTALWWAAGFAAFTMLILFIRLMHLY